jgi:phosphoserine phosphatase
MSRLHVFDLDGTLLREGTASTALARQLGRLPEWHALEFSYSRGDMSVVSFAAGLDRLWGLLTADDVRAAFNAARWIDGIPEVLADIAGRGEYSAVVTMSPDFFAHHLMAIGLHAAEGSRFPDVPFRHPIDPNGILAPATKVRLVDELRGRYGLSRSDCVAYGDSESDLPLFRVIPLSIGVNADPHLDGMTTLDYRGNDLREAYRRVRSAIDTT